MWRFVDLRYQGVGARFAFWSTVTDEFLSLNSSWAWETWADFSEDHAAQVAQLDPIPIIGTVRLRRLCPPWVDRPATDEELEFREDWLFCAYDTDGRSAATVTPERQGRVAKRSWKELFVISNPGTETQCGSTTPWEGLSIGR